MATRQGVFVIHWNGQLRSIDYDLHYTQLCAAAKVLMHNGELAWMYKNQLSGQPTRHAPHLD
jgi:hypothetical protein